MSEKMRKVGGNCSFERQKEEIDSLIAIFDGTVLQESDRRLCIILDREECIQLLVDLPPGYPSTEPPSFQLSAPSLESDKKQAIIHHLEQIYLQNLAEPILYSWIEGAREMLQNWFCRESTSRRQNRSTEQFQRVNFDRDKEKIAAVQNGRIGCVAEEEKRNEFGQEADSCVPEIRSGQPFSDRKSTFQAHAASVSSKRQVELVLQKLKSNSKIARATHNIVAYRIFEERNFSCPIKVQDSDDDGESGAGQKLARLLEILDARNVLVIVTRWYGGVHLGPDRFRHINNLARDILVQTGYGKASNLSSSSSTSSSKLFNCSSNNNTAPSSVTTGKKSRLKNKKKLRR